MVPSSPIGFPYHPVRPSACPTGLTIWLTGSHKQNSLVPKMPVNWASWFSQDRGIERNTAAMQIGTRLNLISTPWFKCPRVFLSLMEHTALSFMEYRVLTIYELGTMQEWKPVESWFLLQESTSRVACYWGLLSLATWVPPHLSMPPPLLSVVQLKGAGGQPSHTQSNKWTFLMLSLFSLFTLCSQFPS